MKMLIIDEERRAQSLKKVLEPMKGPDSEEFVVEIESVYSLAQEKLTSLWHPYDVVILSIEPPSSQDPDAGKQIVAALSGKPVVTIVLTTRPDVKDCVTCIRAGAWDYLDKNPVTPVWQRILDSIREAYETRELRAADGNAQWVAAHYDTLCRDYAGQYIVVAEGSCLGSESTFQEAYAMASSYGGQTGIWRIPPVERGGR